MKRNLKKFWLFPTIIQKHFSFFFSKKGLNKILNQNKNEIASCLIHSTWIHTHTNKNTHTTQTDRRENGFLNNFSTKKKSFRHCCCYCGVIYYSLLRCNWKQQRKVIRFVKIGRKVFFHLFFQAQCFAHRRALALMCFFECI